ncbi:MAG: hypothetical protein AB7Q17_05320 [Phycisphaerae bacterium]
MDRKNRWNRSGIGAIAAAALLALGSGCQTSVVTQAAATTFFNELARSVVDLLFSGVQ